MVSLADLYALFSSLAKMTTRQFLGVRYKKQNTRFVYIFSTVRSGKYIRFKNVDIITMYQYKPDSLPYKILALAFYRTYRL